MVSFRNFRSRVVALATAVIAIAGVGVGVAAPAQAAPVSGSGSTSSLSYCSDPYLWQPFAPWGDYRWFYAMKGGDFESTGPWNLSSGASVVYGNSTAYINPRSANQKSLRIASGATAKATFTCVPAFLDFAFYLKSPTNAPDSKITFKVVAKDPITGISKSETWSYDADQPYIPKGTWLQAWSVPMPGQVGLSSLQTVTMTISVSGGGAWGVDDLLMDPWRSYR